MADPSATLMRGLLEAFLLDRLSRSPRHGYALLKELADLFGDEPNRNKIYPLLQKLEKEGYVEALAEGDGEGRPRTSYQLTEKGRDRLAEYRRMPRAFREAVARFWMEELRN
ncbi:MAG TPA: PadR family transcriptional regulator, partial [Candidatus Thermoplasmatota archaeon]|nr:PadR family transcriptional regulator [Candidatus Thermoplasmatota archaeon]